MNVSSDKIGLNDNQEIDILNLKTREELIGPLRKKEGIYQAYHMNKSKWVSVNLNEMKSVDSIKELIDESYELTS
ncbi:YjbR protein [Pisciglobus halotolerans]|uniref:YjbR protein n=1 Tax=Pisciglobus halotolerans TaxID=745365 RepID=A0A1I3C7A3_9LACT|nr:YjbR protein [Pisciglobus halotolerans]